MLRYFKKEMPSVALHLSTGKRAPFRPSKYEFGILVTGDCDLLRELDIARARSVGGLTEISENEYLALRDGERPKLNPAGPNFKRLKKVAVGRMKIRLVDSGIRTVGQFVHVVERHQQRDLDSERRVENAVASWIYHYSKGMLSCHVWEYEYARIASESIGDPRRLPYLKDLLAEGLKIAQQPDDIVVLTNDDTVLHQKIVPAMTRMLQNVDAISSFRMNFKKKDMPALDTPTAKIRQWGEACHGRDLFAFRADWLRRNWTAIPDMIVGEIEFDLVLAALIRIAAGVETTKENFSIQQPSCELDRGFVVHESHERNWMKEEFSTAPARLHNNRCYVEFCADNGFEELIGKIL